MKVKLYTKVKVREEKSKSPATGATKTIYDPVSGTFHNLMPVPEAEQAEELLGEFNAREIATERGRRYIVVNTPRREVRLDAETLRHETDVNVFRAEEVG